MVAADRSIQPGDLLPAIRRMWELSAAKIADLERTWHPADGSPVFTAQGRYSARGWTEWTQGFQFGSAILQFDATGETAFLDIGRRHTLERMAPHLTHMGVHDHGFNNVSTYGNLWRLMNEGRIPNDDRAVCELALKCSGAVQARRWTRTADGGGFIHSFNGPHSLFVDTVRSLRSLALAHLLGHALMEEQDERISLLEHLLLHAQATARWSVYYGEGRDAYDVRGRTAHESVFNVVNGAYRCPATQQGYSPFSTWTRGLAWAMCGFAEELEFLADVPGKQGCTGDGDPPAAHAGRENADEVAPLILGAAEATCDFYIANAPTDGVPYWDTGAPGLAQMGDYLNRPADPWNEHEPVDSSAAAIAAQGLLRLGSYLNGLGRTEDAQRYVQAGLRVAKTLFAEPYLGTDSAHQGLILHSVYHRPNGWDYVPPGRRIPCGESSMWGDYHARELALLIQRMAQGEPYYTFFGGEGAREG